METTNKFTSIKQDFSQNNCKIEEKIKQIKISEYTSIYKSTDFNAKELDEKLESPINVRTLDSNSSLNTSLFQSTKQSSKFNPRSNSFNPSIQISDFYLDYSSIKNTIHHKNNFITNLNYFQQNYVNDIYSLFNKIDSVIYKKVTMILDKSKYFQRFFKEISSLYETFSINLLHANNTINLHFKDEEENGPFSQVNSTIERTQELISNSFYDFSKNMQSRIISKGPMSNVKEYYNKMSIISKESTAIMSKITQKRDKLIQKYLTFEKIFENFKRSFNDNEKLTSLLNKNEFFIIEFEYCNSVNKLYSRIVQYFQCYKKCIADLKNLTSDFISSIKDTIDLYVQESKKMFMIEDFENVLDNLKIQFNGLFENTKDVLMNPNANKTLNESLKNFQSNLLKFTFIKNENIYNDEYFDIEKYKCFEDLIDFLNTVLPEKLNTVSSNLISYTCDVKKIYGLFKNSRNCTLALTIQGSVLIFEEKINKKLYDKMQLKHLKFKNLEDKRHPFRFEISELKLGMIYNSTHKLLLEAEDQDSYSMIESLLNINK
jgi:hypothetical protein